MPKSKLTLFHVVVVALATVLWPADGTAQQQQHRLATVTTTSPEATLFGPVAATTKIDIRSLTFANTGAAATLEVRVRGVQPSGAGDCLGPATVIDETTWVSVPAGETVHLDFPPQLRTPALEPAGEWCLIVFLPPTPFQVIPAGAEMRVTAVVRIF